MKLVLSFGIRKNENSDSDICFHVKYLDDTCNRPWILYFTYKFEPNKPFYHHGRRVIVTICSLVFVRVLR